MLCYLIFQLVACFLSLRSVCPVGADCPLTLKFRLILFDFNVVRSLTWPITESKVLRAAGSLEGLSSCCQVDPGGTMASSPLARPPQPRVFFKSAEPPASFSAQIEFSMCLLDLTIAASRR